MFYNCGQKVKSQVINGRREKFVRFDSIDSRLSQSSEAGLNKCTLSLQGPKCFAQGSKTSSSYFKKGFRNRSDGNGSISRFTELGVFREDLKVSEKKIFDPQDKFIVSCNMFFLATCILAVSMDPLFLFLPVINDEDKCISLDRKLATTAATLRTVIDSFYLFYIATYVAPSSRVFGRGELVIDPAQIANLVKILKPPKPDFSSEGH